MRPNPHKPWPMRGAALDDSAMEQHIRALAVSLNISGEVPLKSSAHADLHTLMRTARTLAGADEALPAALEWLMENGRLIEAFSSAPRPGKGHMLPAAGTMPRILALLDALVVHSDALISEERLTRCLIAFDEVRSLTMDELWAVPETLTLSLLSACARIAAEAIDAQRDRMAARRWVEEGSPLHDELAARSPAFFECALQQMHDQELSSRHAELARWLAERDLPAERVVALEHERQALGCLTLNNALSSLRMLEQLDWSECFRRASRTERILLTDPSGTYPRMDEDSRELVRRRVCALARATGMGEATMARCAVEAAAQQEDVRREVCWWLYTDEGNRALIGRTGAPARPARPFAASRHALLTGLLALCALALILLVFRAPLPYTAPWCAAALAALTTVLLIPATSRAARLTGLFALGAGVLALLALRLPGLSDAPTAPLLWCAAALAAPTAALLIPATSRAARLTGLFALGAGVLALLGRRLPGLNVSPSAMTVLWSAASILAVITAALFIRRADPPHRRLRPLVPDPHGIRLMSSIIIPALLLCLLIGRALHWSTALIAFPVIWSAVSALAAVIAARIQPPARLLKLKLRRIPDDLRTLVALPALLSSPERAAALAQELETLGSLEKDENLTFLLLGDLPDHTAPDHENDQAILAAAQQAIDRANERAGREKYILLHRPRTLQECEGRYMGRERKRGALIALNRLLTTGENTFAQPDAPRLTGRFPFVLTLDAGTRMIPGTIHQLIGALAHPLNRPHDHPDGSHGGYAILAPRMELPSDAIANAFVRLYGGAGGVDSYPTAVSNLYQDLCGQGSFGGKGIYEVAAFEQAVAGKLPDNAILSHDLIEGLLARAAQLADVTLYDGHPRTVSSFLMRLNRWTRGDWQLIPLLLRGKLRLSALDRHKIIDNLIRSLVAPTQLALILLGFYRHAPGYLALGLLPVLWPLALHPHWTKDDLRRALLRLTLLPNEAHALLSAIVRALYRLTVSRRHLLQWVTADDADRQKGALPAWPGRLAALLMLPALLAPAPWLLADVLLAALWWCARSLTQALERPCPEEHELSDTDRALLHDLAERTWRFFARHTGANGLTPDNVQLDPPIGAAPRTSPTNIGLYLASCVSARELGLIESEEMAARMDAALTTLERLDKWHGQLYNWYHTETLRPLRPLYVSSVDSGNLAACLLLCARALNKSEEKALAFRAEQLARSMDFTPLYDKKRKLFVIGMDVENDRLSGSHYDLMASESRILSFTALMLGQAPVKHWAHLGRMLTPTAGSAALISWSGTMFEYLMPALLLPTWPHTLLRQTQEAVIHTQQAQRLTANGRPLPWGVSESGYYTFDRELNYQYRAFGLPELALRGDPADQVIAPYASMLALPHAPEMALDNLRSMIGLGWMDECGLFEAADCAPERLPEDASWRLVKSHMAHHQGMILCAVCNLLTGNALQRLFMDRSEARALSLLLQEKPAARVRLTERTRPQAGAPHRPAHRQESRPARPGQPLPDSHLLTGAGALALVNADGSGFVQRNGILLNRRESDPTQPPQGFFLHLTDRKNRRAYLLGGMNSVPGGLRQRAQFEPGSALCHTQSDCLETTLVTTLSPEDGAYLQHITLKNTAAAPLELEVTACFQVALCRERDYQAHPAFQNLFIESSLAAPGALRFSRRPRSPEDQYPLLLHVVSGAEQAELTWETDLTRLIGRTGALSRPGTLARTLTGSLGHVLTPCSALRVRLTLPPRSAHELCFAAGLVDPGEETAFIERHRASQAARARELAFTQARELSRYLHLSPALYQALHRGAALICYPRLHARQADLPPTHDLRKSDLWALGISGDLPLLMATVARADQLEPVRELIRAHEFYHSMGLICDLVLINDHGNDYLQPVRDRLTDLIAGSHLCGSTGQQGAVHLIEGAALTGPQRQLLAAAAALTVHDNGGPLARQIQSALARIQPPPPTLPDHAVIWVGSRIVNAFAAGGAASSVHAGPASVQAGIPDLPSDASMADDSTANSAATPGGCNSNALAVPHPAPATSDASMADDSTPDPSASGASSALLAGNSFGGFAEDGYLIYRAPTPTPWCNILCNRELGALVSERGGGFIWRKNSRNGRITPFDNDLTHEGWGDLIALKGEQALLIPALSSATVTHQPGLSHFEGQENGLTWSLSQFVDDELPVKCQHLTLTAQGNRAYAVQARIDWLLGVYRGDAQLTVTGYTNGVWWARGGIDEIAFAAFPGRDTRMEDGLLTAEIHLPAGESASVDLIIGCASGMEEIRSLVRRWQEQGGQHRLSHTLERWQERLSAIAIDTPDPLVNRLVNTFLPYQSLCSRIWGRAGFYQPGGAYGFRDQLQDVLCLMPFNPQMTREHILSCAAHQFQSGDVQHWWHPERSGVRTKISDDLLFLPYVTACYVEETGDRDILMEEAPFLLDVEIPEGREDWYGEAGLSDERAPLHEHCLRAIRRAHRTGEHGLILMGCGDWNDGMNRVGEHGSGESVWLTEFMIVTLEKYAPLCDDTIKEEFRALASRLREAIEQHAWDGRWYRRAYMDNGTPLGSRETPDGCQIDALAQSWAVMAGLSRERVKTAMAEVEKQLIDREHGLIKLLTPPFDGVLDPGYIRGYPPGVRENGGQYTHAACWAVMALSELGQAEKAWEAFRMLLPSSHSDTEDKALTYRVEPYVMAADVYSEPPHTGRGGWTWYTGAAGWMIRAVYTALMGYRRRGQYATLRALLPDGWSEASVRVRVGQSLYTLTARRDCYAATLDGQPLSPEGVPLIDDGQAHQALFPMRPQ